MALLKCKNCGHLISPKAETCPNCHHSYTIKGLDGTWSKIFLFSCILVILSTIYAGVYSLFFTIYNANNSIDYGYMAWKMGQLAPLTSVQAHDIGMFFIVYAMAKTFNTKSIQIRAVALWGASIIIREALVVMELLNIDIMPFKLLVCFSLVIIYIMRMIVFLMMTRQVQKQLKGCIYMLLFANLMYLSVGLMTGLFYFNASLFNLITAIIEFIAIIYLLYISYKK